MADITTIAITGFPGDVTVRELGNFCRLTPGFQRAQPRLMPGKPVVLFVKFESPHAAAGMVDFLQDFAFDENLPDVRLRVDMAKKEMVIREHAPEGYQAAAPMPAAKQPRLAAQPRQPAMVLAPLAPRRVPARVGEAQWPPPAAAGADRSIDTLACKIPAGQAAEDVEAYFRQMPGFLALKPGHSNCFVKFATHVQAVTARHLGQNDGLEVSLARGNMKLPGLPAEAEAAAAAAALAEPHGGWADAGAGDVDTLACKTEGRSEEELDSFFQSLQGFVKFVYKGRNCFVKYDSPGGAAAAMEAARDFGLTADFARHSMY